MKAGIHPSYVVSQVTCACGGSFTTRSTKPVIRLEICSACHPFFTGRQKLLDTAGRVERFKRRFAKTEGRMVARKPKTQAKKLQSAAARKRVLRSTPTSKPEKKDKKKA